MLQRFASLAVLACFLLAAACLPLPAFAFDVTVQGTQVELVYTEPALNKDGSPLRDLAKTTGYFDVRPDGPARPCIETPASALTGGGSIRAVCLVPILQDQEADVRFTVTATDTSGNQSTQSDPVDKRLDFLAPAAPK